MFFLIVRINKNKPPEPMAHVTKILVKGSIPIAASALPPIKKPTQRIIERPKDAKKRAKGKLSKYFAIRSTMLILSVSFFGYALLYFSSISSSMNFRKVSGLISYSLSRSSKLNSPSKNFCQISFWNFCGRSVNFLVCCISVK